MITPIALLLLSPLAAHGAETLPNPKEMAAAAEEPRRLFGDTPLTDDDDLVTNDKPIDLTEDSDFGEGSDGLVNNSVITIGANATAPVHVSLTSLEALKNKGLIDLRNGHGGDVLALSGNYNGTGNGRLGLDVGPDGVDQLVVGAVANGSTAIVLGGLSSRTAVLTGDEGPILVQAGVASMDDAFHIENEEIGFIHYSLVFDRRASTYRLKGVAGERAYAALKISEGAGNVWRQSADAWSAHVANARDGEADGAAVWGQAFGGWQDRDDDIAVADRVVSTDYEQTTYGGQMGVDLINGALGDGSLLIGVTGGYADARMLFTGAKQEAKLRVVNVGGYVALTHGGYFLNALAKVDRQSIKVRSAVDAFDTKFDGTSYGAQIEAGSRGEDGGLMFEKLLGVSYVSTRLDDMNVFSQRLDFDDATGFVAKAGLRGSVESDAFAGALTSYGAAFVVHDFTVKDSLDFVSGDQVEHLSTDGGRTFGQLTMGVSYRSGGAVTFLEASGDYGGGHKGGGLRFGARIGF